MFGTLILSFKLRFAYMANIFIHSIKQLPLIGKEISNNVYSNKGLKGFIYTVIILSKLFWEVFLKKFLYILIMCVAIPSIIYEANMGPDYLRIFPISTILFFLTIIGGINNNNLIDISQDKEYAIFTMKVNAKKYLIGNYIVFLTKVFIGIFIALSILTNEDDLLPIYKILLPLYIICVKLFFSGLKIIHFKTKKTFENDKIYNWTNNILCIGLFVITYAMCFFNISITDNIFFVLFGISVILGSIGLAEILKFEEYKKAYKVLSLERENIVIKNNTINLQKDRALETIDTELKIESNKEGYEFLNDIFVKRHRSILEKNAKIVSAILLLVFAIIFIVAFIFKENAIMSNLNFYLLNSLPTFLFLMYFLNRGQDVTRAMYMNCDHSMLTYKFFKKPDVIVGLFKERLKTVVKVNLVPSIIIATSLPILLYISGGTVNIFNYIILFVSIIAMSIFFSTHHLVIYYLLQPYTVESELKGASYKVVQFGTYMVCYMLNDFKFSTFTFGLITILFCTIYIIIALILAFKFAPKTFRIRD